MQRLNLWRGYFGFCETPYVLIQLTPTASRYVAAMENTTPSPSSFLRTGGSPATGQ